MIRMAAGALAAVRAHAESAYPEECCGALVGRAEPRVVARAVAAENRWGGARFLIPAAKVRDIEREAAGEGLAVVGFYHSHPGGEPVPSWLDREAAWPWYSYLIVAVDGGGAGEARCWRLRDDREGYEPEEMEEP